MSTSNRSEPGEPGDLFIDLRDHPLTAGLWWGSEAFEDTFGPLNINEILGQICVDLVLRPTFPDPFHWMSVLARAGESVLLVTETDGPSKAWSSQRWTSLPDRWTLPASTFDRSLGATPGPRWPRPAFPRFRGGDAG